jgi:uncharacterized protein YjiS (DUF1127 family)
MLPGSLDAEHGVLQASTSDASKRVATLLSAVRRMPHMVWAWIVRSESRRALSMLSDHMLRDIGLTHADVERELLKPFWRE